MENLTLGFHDHKSCKERLMKTQVWHDSLGQVWPSSNNLFSYKRMGLTLDHYVRCAYGLA
jgi:hypothetical protein